MKGSKLYNEIIKFIKFIKEQTIFNNSTFKDRDNPNDKDIYERVNKKLIDPYLLTFLEALKEVDEEYQDELVARYIVEGGNYFKNK